MVKSEPVWFRPEALGSVAEVYITPLAFSLVKSEPIWFRPEELGSVAEVYIIL